MMENQVRMGHERGSCSLREKKLLPLVTVVCNWHIDATGLYEEWLQKYFRLL